MRTPSGTRIAGNRTSSGGVFEGLGPEADQLELCSERETTAHAEPTASPHTDRVYRVNRGCRQYIQVDCGMEIWESPPQDEPGVYFFSKVR